MGKIPDFLRNHRKAGTRLAGPSGFDGSVERQDISLKRNFIDRLEDLGHVGAGGFDGIHRGLHGMHVRRAHVGHFPCLGGQRLGVTG